MKAQRVLSEDELTQQMRISLKKELLAYIKDGVPRSNKIDDLIDMWKQVNSELQTKAAEQNRYLRVLQMLPAKERAEQIDKIKQKMLPQAE